MADFFVWAAFHSVFSSFQSDPQIFGSARDATLASGEDGTLTLNESTAFSYTGTNGNSTGPYAIHSFNMSGGGTALWMAGNGLSGGIVIPTNEAAFNILTAGTAFTVSGASSLSSVAYSTFFVPAANTAPTISGAPSDITVTEDVATNVNFSGITFADAEGDSLTVTLTSSAGTLTSVASTGGVTVSGSGSGTLTLSGTAANINTFLDTASNIQYTGAANANGNNAATITISAFDGDESLASNPTVNVDITAVNDAPTVAGAPTDVAATEDTASTLSLGAMSFADLDGNNLTVTLAASAGTLVASSGGGVTIGGSGTGTLTLTGSAASINSYLDFPLISYTGALNASGNAAATITVSASDGVGGSLASDPIINVNISNTNDEPTATGAPSAVTVTEDTASPLNLSTLSFDDPDGDAITVTLTASAGTMTASSGGGVTIGNSGTSTITLAGTLAAINTYLDTASNIQYTGALNANGNSAASVTVSATDGNGGSLATDPVVNINITAVNDAPTFSGAPADIAVTEDVAGNVDLSALSFADIESDTLTVTLAASAGTLAATSGGGVTIGGTGTNSLTLTGTEAAINIYLDTASNIQYTGAPNANGTAAATITVSASDGQGGSLATDPVVNINIAAANDAPTVANAPTDVTAVEDTASDLDLSAMSFADVEDQTLTVTLTASAGTMAALSSGGVTIGGTGTGTLTLSGTAASINTYLDTTSNIKYTGVLNVNGNDAATITVSASDGTGGVLATNPVINVDITPTNDNPNLLIGPNGSLSGVEDTPVALDLSSIVITDVDESGDMSLILSSGAGGMLSATTTAGVTVSGSGTSTLTLVGTITELHTFLDGANAVLYQGSANAFGQNVDTISLLLNDGEGSGDLSFTTINVSLDGVRDVFPGTEFAETVNGTNGNDTFLASAGGDGLNAAGGVDIIDYRASAEGVNINLTTNLGSGGFAEGDLLIAFENVIGSRLDDELIGDAKDNVLIGLGGDDELLGRGGNDRLRGDGGADSLNGGSGRDTLDYRGSNGGVTVDIDANTASGGQANGDTIANFENIFGSGSNDMLTGNADINILRGGAGADSMDGGLGADWVDYTGSDAGVTVNLSTNVVSGGHAAGDVIANFERVIGSDHDDTLTGTDNANNLRGGSGNDTIDGGLGDDVLFGNGGDDVFIFSDGNDVIKGGQGNDSAQFDGVLGDFLVTNVGLDQFVVLDIATGDTDLLIGVEAFVFTDTTLFPLI